MSLVKKFDKIKIGNNDVLIDGVSGITSNSTTQLATQSSIYSYVNENVEGNIKSSHFVVPTNGYSNDNILKETLEKGTNILTIDFDVKEVFSGTTDPNWGVSVSGATLFDLNDVDLTTVDIYRKEFVTILSYDSNVNVNFLMTGTTGSGIFRIKYGSRSYTDVNSGETIYMNSYVSTMFIRYTGANNTNATINIDGTEYLIGNYDGSLIFDSGGTSETVISEINGYVDVTVNDVTYTIAFLGEGSILISIDSLILTNYGIISFGSNNYGQLGMSNTTDYNGAIQYPSNSSIVKSDCGDETTFLLYNTNTVSSVGKNDVGQLGEFILKNDNILRITPTEFFVFILNTDNNLIAYGSNSTYGDLGMGNTTDYNGEIQYRWTGVTDIGCGRYHNIILFSGGTLASWGRNDQGQLGIGNESTVLPTIQYPSMTGVSQLYTSTTDHNYAKLTNGRYIAWGKNSSGQLALGNETDYTGNFVYTDYYDTTISDITLGINETFLLTTGGTMMSAGYNAYGQLGMGNETDYNGAVVNPSFTGITKIASVYYATLLLFENGTIASFGRNDYGQLGMGNETDYNGTIVYPSFTGVTDISVGQYFGVVLFTGGTIACFGTNSYGELGMGNTTNYNGQIVYPSFTGVTSIYCGFYFTYLILNNETIVTFGQNTHGQLGMGNETNYSGTIKYPQINNFLSSAALNPLNIYNINDISSYYNHSILLFTGGTIATFGSNNYGELGMEDETDYLKIIQYPSFTGITKIAAGENYSLLLENNRIFSFGLNDYGQCGVSKFINLSAATSNEYHTLLLFDDGTIASFGLNDYGQLGTGNEVSDGLVKYPELTGVTKVSAGRDHSIVLFSNGTIATFGLNNYGQLLMGNETDYNGTIVYPSFTGVTDIHAGLEHSTIYFSNNTIAAAGRNTYGTLGMGNETDYNGAIVYPNLTGITEMIGGGYHMVFLTENNTIITFGQNQYDGQLGMGTLTDYNGVFQYPPFTGVTKVFSALHSVFIIVTGGTLISWGYNTYGNLGMGNTTDYNGAIVYPSLTGVTSIDNAHRHTIALFENGTIATFGENTYGELGMENETNYSGAIQYPNFDNVTFIKTGWYNSYIISNNIFYSFGRNEYGQIGIGTTTDYNGVIQTPTFNNFVIKYPELTNISNIYASNYHSAVLLTGGTIATFGRNNYGQLGMNDISEYTGITYPSFTGVTKVALGQYHSILLFSNNTIASFGDNSYGQLGMNNLTNYSGITQYPSFTGITDIKCGQNYTLLYLSNSIISFGDNSNGQLGMGNEIDYSGTTQYPSITGVTGISAGYNHTVLLKNI